MRRTLRTLPLLAALVMLAGFATPASADGGSAACQQSTDTHQPPDVRSEGDCKTGAADLDVDRSEAIDSHGAAHWIG